MFTSKYRFVSLLTYHLDYPVDTRRDNNDIFNASRVRWVVWGNICNKRLNRWNKANISVSTSEVFAALNGSLPDVARTTVRLSGCTALNVIWPWLYLQSHLAMHIISCKLDCICSFVWFPLLLWQMNKSMREWYLCKNHVPCGSMFRTQLLWTILSNAVTTYGQVTWYWPTSTKICRLYHNQKS